VGEGAKVYRSRTRQYFGNAVFEASSLSHITQEGKLLKQDRYITYLGFKNGKFAFKLCSGSYDFNVMD
jgi:hypothetical protein